MNKYFSENKLAQFNNSKNGERFFSLVPIINAIAYVTTGLISNKIFNPGYLRAILVLPFIIWFYLGIKIKYSISEKYINIFLIYLFVLCFFSSDFYKTFSEYLKIFVSMSLFSLGYFYVDNLKRLYNLNNIYIIALFIYVISVVIAIIFGLGYKGYGDSAFFLGATGPNIAKNIVVIVLIFSSINLINYPYFSKNKRRLINVLFIVSIIVMLIALKRSALLSLLVGSFSYFVFSYKKSKYLKVIFISSIFLLILSPFYYSAFKSSLENRSDAALIGNDASIEEESRYLEIIKVIDTFIKGDIEQKLFGSEFLNDTHFFNTRRMLHTDYAALLNGSGLIGLFLYLIIPLIILYQFYKYKDPKQEISTELFAISFALIISSYILGYAGSISSLDLRALIFLYLGSCLKVIQTMNNYAPRVS